MAIKRLSLAHFDAEGMKNNKPIWGLNSVADSDLKQIGEVHLGIKQSNGNGSPDPLFLPVSWLPVELTSMVPRRRLLESIEFRKAVNSKLITLISEKDARRMLDQPGARNEQKRLDAEKSHVKEIGAARTINKKLVSVTKTEAQGNDEDDDGPDTDSIKPRVYDFDDSDDDHVIDAAKSVVTSGVDEYKPGIKQSFKMWLDRLNAKNDDDEAFSLIKSRQSFTTRELRFMTRNLRSSMPRSLRLVTKGLERKLAAKAARA